MLSEKIIIRRLAIIIFIYLLFFVVVIFLTRSPDYFSGVITKGTIEEFETKRVNAYKSSRSFESQPYPVIGYHLKGNEQKYYTGVDRNFYLRNLTVGDTVEIIFDPERPYEASFY